MRDTDNDGGSTRSDGLPSSDGRSDPPRCGGPFAGTARGMSADGGPRGDERAQSLNDFALGTGVFVLTVGFVFFLMPTLLAPYYSPSETGNEIRAERSTAVLVDDLLVKSGEHEPNTLNATCTEDFFAPGTDLGCGYAGSTLSEQLGLASDGNVNVSISRLGSGSTGGTVSIDGNDDGTTTTLARGDSVPSNSNVGVWTRVVYVNGTSHELTVRVW